MLRRRAWGPHLRNGRQAASRRMATTKPFVRIAPCASALPARRWRRIVRRVLIRSGPAAISSVALYEQRAPNEPQHPPASCSHDSGPRRLARACAKRGRRAEPADQPCRRSHHAHQPGGPAVKGRNGQCRTVEPDASEKSVNTDVGVDKEEVERAGHIPAMTGSLSIERRPGRRRQWMSVGFAASCSFGQRVNSACKPQAASIRAS